MTASSLYSIFAGFLKLAILAGGVLYAGLVLMSYRTDGPHYRLRVNLRDPARSAERLLVWLGVKALRTVVRLAVLTFGMLSEASAEVGEWFLSRRAPETQAAVRSRFLL